MINNKEIINKYFTNTIEGFDYNKIKKMKKKLEQEEKDY